MARHIDATVTHVWRAVIVWENRDTGETVFTEHLGPYCRKADALNRVSAAKRQRWGLWTCSAGRVESAPLGEWSVTES